MREPREDKKIGKLEKQRWLRECRKNINVITEDSGKDVNEQHLIDKPKKSELERMFCSLLMSHNNFLV